MKAFFWCDVSMTSSRANYTHCILCSQKTRATIFTPKIKCDFIQKFARKRTFLENETADDDVDLAIASTIFSRSFVIPRSISLKLCSLSLTLIATICNFAMQCNVANDGRPNNYHAIAM
jgi:hypothetical protein